MLIHLLCTAVGLLLGAVAALCAVALCREPKERYYLVDGDDEVEVTQEEFAWIRNGRSEE